jgi:hypothetical protein
VFSRFSVSSFKAFDGQADLDLASINLIYGENSSGKSSLIQSILMMKQSLVGSAAAWEEATLDFRGSQVDLGGFNAAVHGHDAQAVMQFSYDVAPGNRPIARRNNPFGRAAVSYDLDYVFDDDLKRPRLNKIRIRSGQSDFRFVYAQKSAGTGFFIETTESADSMLAQWRKVSSADQGKTADRREPTAEELKWIKNWLRRTPADLLSFVPVWDPGELRSGRPGRPVGGSLESSRRLILQEFVFDWQLWAIGLRMILAREFENTHYVGPLRQAPQRIAIDSSGPSKDLGSRGERALRLLSKDPDLLHSVNAALQEMEVPYVLDITELSAGDDSRELGEISILSLRDTRSGLIVTLGDVGVGISQIIPVLMQLFLNRRSLILVEQPELHLHPRLQSRFADIVIAASRERGNIVVLETHSEHILTRIQRRVRSSSFPADQLHVYYVDQVGGSARLSRLRIDDQGQMIDSWPSGFFDERLNDLLADDEVTEDRVG